MNFIKTHATVFLAAFSALFITSCSNNSELTGSSSRSSTAMAYAKAGDVDSGFIQPKAPSQSAKPYGSLPSMGRDKHKMPYYHHQQRNRVVRTTAYTHSESDHLAYGARNAVGTSLKYTSTVRSAAADWAQYPLGTKFRIKGQPYLYVVDDYGSALVGTGTIDIYQPSKNLMKQWGRRYVEIMVVQWGSPEASMEVLAARKGYKHCRAMYANLAAKHSKGLYAKAE